MLIFGNNSPEIYHHKFTVTFSAEQELPVPYKALQNIVTD